MPLTPRRGVASGDFDLASQERIVNLQGWSISTQQCYMVQRTLLSMRVMTWLTEYTLYEVAGIHAPIHAVLRL